MIQFANEEMTPVVRQMWKTCFGDTDTFLDIFFRYKYKPENTLLYFEDGKAIAALQMLPYAITFHKQEIPFAYLAGLCTLPEYRNKGIMGQLIHEAHRIITQRNIPLAILIPAEEWLYGYYGKFGYEQVFESDDTSIPLRQIIDAFPDEKGAYAEFDLMFRPLDLCVQKTETDFVAIKEDYISENCPVKTNLSGMARVIDVSALLGLYAKGNLSQSFTIKVTDSEIGESKAYFVDKGEVGRILKADRPFDMEVDTKLLCRLLFGFNVSETNTKFHSFFREHHPIMNLMLE